MRKTVELSFVLSVVLCCPGRVYQPSAVTEQGKGWIFPRLQFYQMSLIEQEKFRGISNVCKGMIVMTDHEIYVRRSLREFQVSNCTLQE